MIEERLQKTPGGAIVFDAACAAQADPRWFDPDWWRAGAAVGASAAGRGAALYVDAPFGASVLRHYRRGGIVARVLGDRYLWTGAARTRSFAEFRLLVRLRDAGLPVPAPVAAHYVRHGLNYSADLITRRIENAPTLADRLASGDVDAATMARIGACIGEFHAAGVYHADLNAHNILVGNDRVWLIDFDRGRSRRPDPRWQRANLVRLRRSLRKLGAGGLDDARFERELWAPLVAAWQGCASRRVDAAVDHREQSA